MVFAIITDIRYYYMIMMVPMAALLPDITVNMISQVFYSKIEDILMYMQGEMAGNLPIPK